jgi:hypothetical protein
MDIVEWGDLEHHADLNDYSHALSQGKIRTNEDVKRGVKELFRQEKMRDIYLHLNPLNYLRKDKPYGWNKHFKKEKPIENPKLY